MRGHECGHLRRTSGPRHVFFGRRWGKPGRMVGFPPVRRGCSGGRPVRSVDSGGARQLTAVSRQALLAGGDLLGAAWSQTLQSVLVLLLTGGALIFLGRDVAIVLLAYLAAQVLVALAALLRLARRGQVRRKPRVSTMRSLSGLWHSSARRDGRPVPRLSSRHPVSQLLLGPRGGRCVLGRAHALRGSPRDSGGGTDGDLCEGRQETAQLPVVGSMTRMIFVATVRRQRVGGRAQLLAGSLGLWARLSRRPRLRSSRSSRDLRGSPCPTRSPRCWFFGDAFGPRVLRRSPA